MSLNHMESLLLKSCLPIIAHMEDMHFACLPASVLHHPLLPAFAHVTCQPFCSMVSMTSNMHVWEGTTDCCCLTTTESKVPQRLSPKLSSMSLLGIQACFALQVEKELAEERVAAEAEAKRAQEAIQAKQRELQQIEQQRQHEVHNTQQPPLLPFRSSLFPPPSPLSSPWYHPSITSMITTGDSGGCMTGSVSGRSILLLVLVAIACVVIFSVGRVLCKSCSYLH